MDYIINVHTSYSFIYIIYMKKNMNIFLSVWFITMHFSIKTDASHFFIAFFSHYVKLINKQKSEIFINNCSLMLAQMHIQIHFILLWIKYSNENKNSQIQFSFDYIKVQRFVAVWRFIDALRIKHFLFRDFFDLIFVIRKIKSSKLKFSNTKFLKSLILKFKFL